jgi:hypothetical protein
MSQSSKLFSLVTTIVSLAYPELFQSKLSVSWGRTSSLAQVQWEESKDEISIRVNRCVREWHEAGITGLLSHELSHPAQRGTGLSEVHTDTDALTRGFGPYLAVERLFAGKYEDHMIRKGKDRYLGYRSIRTQLTNLETEQLDMLLSEIGLAPTRPRGPVLLSHDVAVIDQKRNTTITVEGHQFIIPYEMKDPDIKIVERDSVVHVYSDEILVGQFIVEED